MNIAKGISAISGLLDRDQYSYPTSRYYYYYKHEHYSAYNILKEPSDFQDVLKLTQTKCTHDFKSPSKILPLDLDFSFTMGEVIKHKGKPRFVIEGEHSSLMQKIFFYKSKIGGFSFLTQLHFIKNTLWVIKQDVSYQDGSPENFSFITKLLLKKYSVEFAGMVIVNEQIRISDDHCNHMFIKNSFKTEILYVNDNPTVLSTVNNWIKKSNDIKMQTDRFIENRLLKNL